MKLDKKTIAIIVALICAILFFGVIGAVSCGKNNGDKDSTQQNSTQSEQESSIKDSIEADDLFAGEDDDARTATEDGSRHA